ncbi:hypothetical protein PGSY75_1221600 [Plasmodium gaboni]|uniref:EIPR1-like beta-propeller domain-containing protein n=1 Tax=Plasmodium gaboni TaxID=647221 RepID=A0A151LGC0_9APIC|nr:hypothetical protein PGSY75_1221600 [Plasmodium gaboni]KYN98020.1 hypothetical protein PGSY75_1221600 [Plasmodium gaboni]
MYTKRFSKNTYYLPYKSKCLSNVNGSLLKEPYNLHYFLLGTNNPSCENEIHLIEYNDQFLSVRNIETYHYEGESEHLVCLDMYENEDQKKKIIFCTAGYEKCNEQKMNNNDMNYNECNEYDYRNDVCSLWMGDIDNLDDDNNNDNNNNNNNDNNNIDNNNNNHNNHYNNIDKMTNYKNQKNYTKKKKKKLTKVLELKKGNNEDYKYINKIVVNDFNKEYNKICIIDKNNYSIFDRSKNDINFMVSKNVNYELIDGIFDPHHENILTVMSNIKIYGYDIRSNMNIFSTYTNHKADLSSIDFNSNIPNILLTSSNDGYIKLWDLRFLKDSFFTTNIHSHWITSIHFNHFHDELLLSTSTDHMLKLHKISLPTSNFQNDNVNYELIKTYTDHEDSVYKGCWSKTDAWVFSSLSYDGKCVVHGVPIEQKYKILL